MRWLGRVFIQHGSFMSASNPVMSLGKVQLFVSLIAYMVLTPWWQGDSLAGKNSISG